MLFELRLEHVKEAVSTIFTYNDVFVDKLPRNKRTGVRLARVKFASYNTDNIYTMYKMEEDATDLLQNPQLQVCSINSHRCHAILTKRSYDSLIIHMVIDKY